MIMIELVGVKKREPNRKEQRTNHSTWSKHKRVVVRFQLAIALTPPPFAPHLTHCFPSIVKYLLFCLLFVLFPLFSSALSFRSSRQLFNEFFTSSFCSVFSLYRFSFWTFVRFLRILSKHVCFFSIHVTCLCHKQQNVIVTMR